MGQRWGGGCVTIQTQGKTARMVDEGAGVVDATTKDVDDGQ